MPNCSILYLHSNDVNISKRVFMNRRKEAVLATNTHTAIQLTPEVGV